MTVKRAALLAGFIVVGIAVLVAAVAAWLLATTSGLHFVWNRIDGLLPDVRVESLDGRLIGPLSVQGLEVTTGGARVALDSAEIDWEPLALFGRSFNADAVRLRGLEVVLVPPDEAPAASGSEPFQLPDSMELPVAVNVETLTLDGASIYPAPDADPFVIDSASFSAYLGSNEWIVHEIVVRGPLLDLDGRIATSPRGRYASEAELAWIARPPGDMPPVAGRTVVSGNLSALRVEQTVAPPYEIDADVTVDDPLGQLALDGAVNLRVAPAELGYELPVTEVAASVTVRGPLDDLALSGRVEAPAPDLADLELEVDGRYTGTRVDVDSLRVADAGSPAELTLTGEVGLTPDIVVDLEGDWASLQWPTRGEPVVASRSGTLRLEGSPEDLTAALDAAILGGGIEGTLRRAGERIVADLEWRGVAWPEEEPDVISETGSIQLEGVLDDYTLTVDSDLALAEGASGHVRLQGTGSLERLDLTRLDVAALDGTLEGQGFVAWAPDFEAELDLTAQGLDPGTAFEGMSGRIGGDVRAAAAVTGGELVVELARLGLSGQLRGRPVELDARGQLDAGDALIESFSLRAGETAVTASGSMADQLDLEWQLSSPDLADLWPDLAGRLDVEGRASGPRLRPVIELDASGAELDVLGAAVDALSIAADIDLAGLRPSQLSVDVRAVRYADSELDSLTIEGGGDAARHALSLTAAGQGADAALELSGSLQQPWQSDYAWNFTLEQARLAYTELGPWSLRAPASGRVTAAGTELDETCFETGDASLCFDAASGRGSTETRFALAQLPFQYFASFLPSGARMTGTLSADGEIVLDPGEPPRVDVRVATSRGRFGSEAAGGGVAGFTFGAGTGRFEWDGEGMNVNVDWPFEREQGALRLEAAVVQAPDEPFTDSAVNGSLFVELRDLSFVPDLVDEVAAAAGAIAGDIRVEGTVARPRVAGRIDLTDGTARLRTPGITLEGVQAALVGDGRGGVSVEAQGRSGGGEFEADGRLELDGAVPVGQLVLRGEDLQLIDTPDATVYVTPDLTLALEPQRLSVTGEVLLPRADITPRGTTGDALRPSSDQIFIDEEDTTVPGTTRPVYARVRIRLGDQVTFEGFGLTGRLGGALEVVETPGEPTTGSGELRVEDGTYVAYGQELEIRTGRLVFAGGTLTRPGLDIEAVRRPAEDVLVGARVQGTLRQPELSVFSEPPMARQEQLSYLVLGRPLENASASENSALSQAAMALGLRGGNFVSDRVNQSLGFDEFGIQTQPGEDANSASFVIGKYLSPSLYVSYGVGLFQPVNTLRLRYTISSRWRLVTESSSEGSGGDLIFHIER